MIFRTLVKILIFLLVIITTNSFGQTISTKGYFFLRENQIDHFTGKYVPFQNDPNNKEMQLPIPPPPSGRSYNDTITEKKELTYKTINIQGHKAYYIIETVDTLNQEAIIGFSHFLSCVLIFENDTVLLAPVYKKADLHRLKFSEFKYYIPPLFKKSDTIFIIDGKEKTLLYDFKKVSLHYNGKEFKDCLNIQIIERWSDATYSGQVWLSKKYGVLKWIRTTGRVETKDF